MTMLNSLYNQSDEWNRTSKEMRICTRAVVSPISGVQEKGCRQVGRLGSDVLLAVVGWVS